MDILINVFSNYDQLILRNFLEVLYRGLVDLGHRVHFETDHVDKTKFNLFFPPLFPTKLVAALEGLSYGVIPIELHAWPGADKDVAIIPEAEVHREVIRRAKFCAFIHKDWEPHARAGSNQAHYLPYGFHPDLDEVRHMEPDVDLYYFGSLTPDYLAMFKTLMQKGVAVRCHERSSLIMRNNFIGRSRACLHYRPPGHKYQHAAPQRSLYLANNRRAVIANQIQDPDGYLDFAHVVPNDDFIDHIRSYLARDTWRRDGEAAYEAFSQRPMSRYLEELLDNML